MGHLVRDSSAFLSRGKPRLEGRLDSHGHLFPLCKGELTNEVLENERTGALVLSVLAGLLAGLRESQRDRGRKTPEARSFSNALSAVKPQKNANARFSVTSF